MKYKIHVRKLGKLRFVWIHCCNVILQDVDNCHHANDGALHNHIQIGLTTLLAELPKKS